MVSELVAERNIGSGAGNYSPFAADVSVGGNDLAEIDRSLEQIIDWVNKEFGTEQLLAAKEEFFWKAGKVFYDDLFFSQRMGYFMDYFVFQRLFQVDNPALCGLTPFQAYHELFRDKDILIRDARHSVFQIQKLKEHEMQLLDLLADEKILISKRETESFRGIHKKDVFQGFIYISADRCFLSRGLIFHPEEAVPVIKKFLKKEKKSKELDELKILSRLARQQLRQLRHRHVDPKIIYKEEPAF